MNMSRSISAILAGFILTSSSLALAEETSSVHSTAKRWMPDKLRTTRQYNAQILKKVDNIVRQNFYSEDLVKSNWIPAVERERATILASHDYTELFKSINHALASLKSSHCEFVTF